MTHQETFDLIVAHLRKQNEKSLNGDYCRYKNADGLKCAVGALIPDEKYSISLEERNALEHPVAELLLELGHDPALCNRLQIVHDVYLIDDWEEQFREVAREFRLKYTPVEDTVK